MTDLVITVVVKDQYGCQVVHPACPKAQAFASIAGTKTLTHQAIKQIKALGYAINVQQKEVQL
jgi:hypothetical protein